MLQDLRFGFKLLLKERAFTATALLTLALCIGANTAIFSVLHAVVLNPLPFDQPDRLVRLWNIYPGVGFVGRGANAAPDLADRRTLTDVFESIAMTDNEGFDIGGAGTALRVDAQAITPSFFEVLRVSTLIGRPFTTEEAVHDKNQYAILSYGLWNELYAKDPHAIGKDIRLSGRPHRIVGVMPQGFESPGSEARLWVPLAFSPKEASDDGRHSNSWGMIARLKPGVSIAYAQQRIDALNKQLEDKVPKFKQLIIDAKFRTLVAGLKDEMVQDFQPMLYLLQGAVTFVLLIGCVNVANLLLVRSNVRMKELAIRHSLGAGRWRLGRQMLVESVTLAVLGGALGVFTGWGGMRLLTYLGSQDLPRGTHVQMDGRVLAFSVAVAVITGLVFGSVPVYHLFRRDLNAVFRSNERGGTSERRALWTRSALVVLQVSLAFVLLIGSGLLTLSFVRLLAVKPGFQPEKVLTARISLPSARYADDARVAGFTEGLLAKVRALPGVDGAGIATTLPFANNNNAGVILIDGYVRAPGENPPVPSWTHVDPGYFQALGIPLVAGRPFTETDRKDAPRVAIIDEFMAKKYWPKGNAIGAGFFEGLERDSKPPTRIVGVVGSVKSNELDDATPVGRIYYPYRQTAPRDFHIVVKEKGEGHVVNALREELRRTDPEIALFDVKAMNDRISASVGDRRAAMWICLVFAGLALVLSAIGIYGVLAYTVTQRTREFGIRLALGAEARDVVRMVLGQGVKLAAAGLVLGVAGAVALTRLMTDMLFDVKPTEPGVFVAVALALMVVALVASLVPSLRVIRIKPVEALRYE